MRKLAIPLVLLLIAALVFVLTRPDEDLPPVSQPTAAPSQEPEPITEAVLVEGTRLLVLEFSSGNITEAARLPSQDVSVSTDGTLWAAMEGELHKRDPDPAIEPTTILVGDVDGDDAHEIGIGYSPLWSPDDEFVAAVVPVDGYLICPVDANLDAAQNDPGGEGCTEGERVAFYDPSGETEPSIAIGGGAWDLVGWTGEHQIVAQSAENRALKLGFADATDDQQVQIPLRRSEVKAMSPTETLLLVSQGGSTVLVDESAEGGEPVDLTGHIDAATWSPSGDHIAVAHDRGISLIDVDNNEVVPVTETKVTGSLVWSSDSQTFGFLAGSQKIMICTVDGPSCDEHPVSGAVKLLALR